MVAGSSPVVPAAPKTKGRAQNAQISLHPNRRLASDPGLRLRQAVNPRPNNPGATGHSRTESPVRTEAVAHCHGAQPAASRLPQQYPRPERGIHRPAGADRPEPGRPPLQAIKVRRPAPQPQKFAKHGRQQPCRPFLNSPTPPSKTSPVAPLRRLPAHFRTDFVHCQPREPDTDLGLTIRNSSP